MIINEFLGSDYFFRVKSAATEYEIPEGQFLFNQASYLQSFALFPRLSFELWNSYLLQSVAILHIFIQQDQAVSPLRATFGGIEISSALPTELLDTFIQRIHCFLSSQPIKSIRLTNYPFAYDTQTAQRITAALLHHGYTITIAETNYHINIDDNSLLSRLHSSERRRFRKSQQAGFIFREELTPDLSEIHAFIYKARIRKGFPMSLSLDAFRKLFLSLPDVYRIFSVRQEDILAALTVTVRINDKILYNFYPADNESFLNYSPTVFLTVELYNLAQQEGYRILDLGIATDNGTPNYGLMRFKSNLGAAPSLRLSFQKVFT